MSKDTVKLFQRARAALQSEKDSLSKALANAQATAADAEKRLAEIEAALGGAGTAPAENHVLLLEDEASHCLREGKVWKLKEGDIKDGAGKIVARRESKTGSDKAAEETLPFDAATLIWRGREKLQVAALVDEGTWPESG